MTLVHCRDCGKKISEKAETCPDCGAPTGVKNVKPTKKSREVAAWLGIIPLTGAFGIHKFYIGETGKGFLYLIFFWTYIPLILALIQGFKFLFMSDKEFSKYLSENA